MSDQMDAVVRLTLARRIAADTGTDEATALEMVADVASRGADSPHAEVVSDAARAILAPVTEAFGRFFTEMAAMVEAWAARIGEALRPAFSALAATEDERSH